MTEREETFPEIAERLRLNWENRAPLQAEPLMRLINCIESCEDVNLSGIDRDLIVYALARALSPPKPPDTNRAENILREFEELHGQITIDERKWLRERIATELTPPGPAEDVVQARGKRLADTAKLIINALNNAYVMAQTYPVPDNAAPALKDGIARRTAMIGSARHEASTTLEHDIAALHAMPLQDRAIPVAEWKIVVDERVLIYVVHTNAQFEKDEKKRRDEWEGWTVGRWIDHNHGGWMYYGMMGEVTHVAPLPGVPLP